MSAPLWKNRSSTPFLRGWYVTRTESGHLQWRAWGTGGWWKQLKDGWIQFFDGDGQPILYDWMPRSRKSIDLDSHQLPGVEDYLFQEPEKSCDKEATK